METKTVNEEIVQPLNKEYNKKYISNKKDINEFSLEEVNPVMGIKLTKRFMIAIGAMADVIEYLDHVMNFKKTKDTLLFLFIASFILYTYKLALIYLPLLVVVKILYASSKNETYPKRELDIKRSYRTNQRIMNDTADYVEFFDLFVRDYVFWYNRDKTMRLLVEMLKLSAFSVLVYLFIPLNYVLIFNLWNKVLQRSHFFWWISTVVKNFNKDCMKRVFGKKYSGYFDPPLDGLFDMLAEENNKFSKYT